MSERRNGHNGGAPDADLGFGQPGEKAVSDGPV